MITETPLAEMISSRTIWALLLSAGRMVSTRMAGDPARVGDRRPGHGERCRNLGALRNGKPTEFSSLAFLRGSLHCLLPAFKDAAHRDKLVRPFALQGLYPLGRIGKHALARLNAEFGRSILFQHHRRHIVSFGEICVQER
jgi:hypothetical protein